MWYFFDKMRNFLETEPNLRLGGASHQQGKCGGRLLVEGQLYAGFAGLTRPPRWDTGSARLELPRHAMVGNTYDCVRFEKKLIQLSF